LKNLNFINPLKLFIEVEIVLNIESEVRVNYHALKSYIDKVGGTLIEENNNVEILIPVVVEEVTGGIQFHLKGTRIGDDVVIKSCTVTIESEKTASIDVSDLDPWLRYIAEKCMPSC